MNNLKEKMEHCDNARSALRIGIYGAVLTIIGILLSGPLGFGIVVVIQPSPALQAWQGAQAYAQHYHRIQALPYFGGFVLVIGYIVMMAAFYQIAEEKQKTPALIAIIFTAIFSTLVFFNYIDQTTFLPALAKNYRPEYDPAISTFSMANPHSLSWAIEMWGYAFLGMATWSAASVFKRDRLEKTTATLMIVNGIVSIVGAGATSFDLGWVLTSWGLLSYVVWNLLALTLSIFIIASLRRREAQSRR